MTDPISGDAENMELEELETAQLALQAHKAYLQAIGDENGLQNLQEFEDKVGDLLKSARESHARPEPSLQDTRPVPQAPTGQPAAETGPADPAASQAAGGGAVAGPDPAAQASQNQAQDSPQQTSPTVQENTEGGVSAEPPASPTGDESNPPRGTDQPAATQPDRSS